MVRNEIQKQQALLLGTGFLLGIASYNFLVQQKKNDEKPKNEHEARDIAMQFFEAQSERNLDLMCDLCTDDVTYINEPHDESRYIKNKAKWTAARSFCSDNNMQFKIITEKDLGVGKY